MITTAVFGLNERICASTSNPCIFGIWRSTKAISGWLCLHGPTLHRRLLLHRPGILELPALVPDSFEYCARHRRPKHGVLNRSSSYSFRGVARRARQREPESAPLSRLT